jgi:hypothetical protein
MELPFVFESNFAILIIRNLRIKSTSYEATNFMLLRIRSYKNKGSQPKKINNEVLRRYHILLHIHKTGITKGTLLFVSIRSVCLVCVYI